MSSGRFSLTYFISSSALTLNSFSLSSRLKRCFWTVSSMSRSSPCSLRMCSMESTILAWSCRTSMRVGGCSSHCIPLMKSSLRTATSDSAPVGPGTPFSFTKRLKISSSFFTAFSSLCVSFLPGDALESVSSGIMFFSALYIAFRCRCLASLNSDTVIQPFLLESRSVKTLRNLLRISLLSRFASVDLFVSSVLSVALIMFSLTTAVRMERIAQLEITMKIAQSSFAHGYTSKSVCKPEGSPFMVINSTHMADGRFSKASSPAYSSGRYSTPPQARAWEAPKSFTQSKPKQYKMTKVSTRTQNIPCIA
mmetsp:Transcript_51252/g.115409  ORF Transcript_51252/g.115409 Transcript_51252/m.115409 type:complete len:308 (+) Transcript_51252:1530-2453(+)